MSIILSEGKLVYSRDQDSFKLIVEVDPGMAFFYRSLVPKSVNIQSTRYPPHITVIRKEVPNNLVMWEAHHLETVMFEYDSNIQHDDVYWWLPVNCSQLNRIREALGLPRWSELCRPPDGSDHFHITIGNTKGNK